MTVTAIVEISGKQYHVEEGRYITIDLLDQAEDAQLTFDKVNLLINGEAIHIGAPYVAGATVQAKVLNHFRGPKVLVYKMRCKKGYRRKNGHRQSYTRIQIESIKG
ncbi:MAG: 50S ribosomal protein L21 [Vampirovibrionales bacterium]